LKKKENGRLMISTSSVSTLLTESRDAAGTRAAILVDEERPYEGSNHVRCEASGSNKGGEVNCACHEHVARSSLTSRLQEINLNEAIVLERNRSRLFGVRIGIQGLQGDGCELFRQLELDSQGVG
jgi:hypothetical protein